MSSSNTHSRSARKPTPRQLRYLRLLAERSGTTFTMPRTVSEAKRLIDELKDRKGTPRADIARERRQVADDMATRRGDGARVKPEELSGWGSSATWAADAGEEAGPRVVHCEREPFDVYCGRGSRSLGLSASKWANPFRIGRDGTREQVIAKHKRWLLREPQLLAALEELRGRTLGCHCAPQACHCDTLLELANAPRKRQHEQPTVPAAGTPSPSALPSSNGEPHAFLGYTVDQERRLIVVQRIDGAVRVGDLPADGEGARYLVADRLESCGELDALLRDYIDQAREFGAIPASPARALLQREPITA